MFVQFVMNRLAAPRVAHHPLDAFSSRAAFYQTWQLCDLDAERHEGGGGPRAWS